MTADYGRIALDLGSKLASAPLQIETHARLGIDHESLFAYVTDIERLPEWLPMARTAEADDSKAETPSGVGSVRKIYTFGNSPTCERVVYLEAPRLYAYSARDKDLMGMFTKHLGVISVEKHHARGSVLTWLAYGEPSRIVPLHYMGMRVVGHVLRKGIANLEKRFPIT